MVTYRKYIHDMIRSLLIPLLVTLDELTSGDILLDLMVCKDETLYKIIGCLSTRSWQTTYILWKQMLIVVRKFPINISAKDRGRSINYWVPEYTMQISKLLQNSLRKMLVHKIETHNTSIKSTKISPPMTMSNTTHCTTWNKYYLPRCGQEKVCTNQSWAYLRVG